MNSKITELAQKYVEIRNEHSLQSAKLKEINTEYEDQETQLIDAMVEEGIKTIKIEGLGSFTFVNRVFLSYTAATEEQVKAYLKKIGKTDLVKESVMKAAFGEFISPHYNELVEGRQVEGNDLAEARAKVKEFLKGQGINEFTKKTLSLKKA